MSVSAAISCFRSNLLLSQLLAGMQAGVGTVIASVVWDMGTDAVRQKNTVSIGIMLGAFLTACFFHVNVVYIILCCIVLGIVRTLRPAVVAMIASAGVLLLVNAFWDGGAGDACRDKLDDAAAFCRLLAAAAQNKAEPNSDNGTRGSHQCREICFGRIAGSGKSD